jgi:hypothetical protein
MKTFFKIALFIVLFPLTIFACVVLGLASGFANPIKTRNDV